MKKKRKIAIVTGTRAEYGILKPLLEKIKASKNLELKLMVTGMHLLRNYGLTINEIKKDGFGINKEIKMYDDSETDSAYYGRALAAGIKNFAEAFLQINPDILVVFGDRLEPLAATLAAAPLNIPIAHIHGGDKSDSGHIDEGIRHSITKFAHIHFAPTKECQKRLIKMGEETWRIYNVGALNIDSILHSQKIKKEILFKKLGLDSNQKLILCIFSPVHLEANKAGKQMHEIIKALKELKIQTMIIYPNNDYGSQDIIAEIKKVKNLPFIQVSPNLLHNEYINLLKYTNVLIGNSSSGIIEAPSIKLPVVNIGSRNTGREHAENIVFADPNKNKIIKAINKTLYDKKLLSQIKKCKNPWGNGTAHKKITKILKELFPLTPSKKEKLLIKKLSY